MAPEGGQLADRDVLSDSWTVGKPTPVTLGRPAGSERLAGCSRRAALRALVHSGICPSGEQQRDDHRPDDPAFVQMR
jgi:hypothetical protein